MTGRFGRLLKGEDGPSALTPIVTHCDDGPGNSSVNLLVRASRLGRITLRDTGGIPIRSAGTRALSGRPMRKFTAQALERMGIDGRGFTSRRLTARDVEESDLVLTMTAQHRAEVLGLAPRRLRRVFTLVEAAALSEAVDRDHLAHLAPGDRGPALADALADGRAMRHGRPRQDEDILDPVSMPASVHAEVVDRIADTLRSIPLLSGRAPGDRSLEQVSAPGRDPRRPRPPFGEPD